LAESSHENFSAKKKILKDSIEHGKQKIKEVWA
jgi:hypothetical protein